MVAPRLRRAGDKMPHVFEVTNIIRREVCYHLHYAGCITGLCLYYD